MSGPGPEEELVPGIPHRRRRRVADKKNRRELMAAALGAGLSVAASPPKSAPKMQTTGEPEVAPAEDLMREHGLLNRVLLVYEEGIRRLDRHAEVSASVFASAAEIIRRFIEDYHEKLEEDNLFPRFEKAGKLVDLVTVLRQQHQAGRMLTANIPRLPTPPAPFPGA